MRTHLPFGGFLSAGQLKQIDGTGRRILAEIGLTIQDKSVLECLKASGAQVDVDAQRVRFPEDWLDDILNHAPSGFTLYSRDGKNDVHLGAGSVYFANGGRVFRILDMKTRVYRSTALRDLACTAALVDQLDNIQLYIIACQAHDVTPKTYHLNDFYHALNHTTKHVMGGCDTLVGVIQMRQLASVIAGGDDKLAEKPFVSVITNPISPLTIDRDSVSILQFCAVNGIPVTCAPAPISGATAPVTLAGTLSQMHAEALAGVALTQVFAPGAKVLYGAVPSTMDLRHMDYCMSSVEAAIMNAAAVQLSKHYHLPIYATGGVTDSKTPDIQAGCEKSLSTLLAALNGADLIHLAAGMLDSGNSICFEQYVIDNEIIGMIYRILKGISVNTDTLGYEVIKTVAPGGNYVIEDHTVDHMMDEFFYPDLSVRCNLDIWEEKGRPDMVSCAGKKAEEILINGPIQRLTTGVITEINRRFPGIQSI
jgi:trimethylamine--corrinoid protein Co-methyltransferase